MDKKRLVENIESLWDIANGLASYSGVNLSDKEKQVVVYFIEQAERVEEQQEENARLREALNKAKSQLLCRSLPIEACAGNAYHTIKTAINAEALEAKL